MLAVLCYECELSADGCNEGPLLDNDTTSICPVGDPGVGCWVSIKHQQALSLNSCIQFA